VSPVALTCPSDLIRYIKDGDEQSPPIVFDIHVGASVFNVYYAWRDLDFYVRNFGSSTLYHALNMEMDRAIKGRITHGRI
jgi:hypothetical protein